ncbi:MAG: acyltransferase domain-containing protein [Deltaproteobacteria bacterium]|nr:acyltransferase domain-containing protein [Deltaproteobacteria bacterium]
MSRYDIAVIGMGCVLPNANNVEQYWKNILSGDSYFKEMPERLWHLKNFSSPNRDVPEKAYTTMGAFIEDFEFPFLEYKLPPKTMQGVDPAQLVTLEAAREALLDAGIEPRSDDLIDAITIIGSSGVDLFAHSTTYLKRHAYLKKLRPLLEARGVSAKQISTIEKELEKELKDRGHTWHASIAAVAAVTSSVSNRVAQVFGIKGFNMTVDAACASSFVAMDTACQALMAGDTRIAVAGGSDLGTNPAIYIGFSRVDGLSISGHSCPFDHTADGLIIGEGVGMVVLKRLEDALEDGDRVRAVIRAVGSSSDGAGQAIYAPSVKGRALALRNALKKAELSPHEVQYVEAHATSTIVGDANEYDAISSVYSEGRDLKDPLNLGSVKHQIGHLKAAAGVAGFIKTVLAMENGKMPHMPRFTKLTPGAENPSPALVVPSKMRDWEPRSNGKRVAAVTSSGFGGVNYHFIVEQGDSYSPPSPRPEISREMAIVGMTCRVAGADTTEKFWSNIKQGVDVFSKVDPEELGWEDHFDVGPKDERITTRVVSRIDDYKFNLLRHKIFPNAVSQMAPTQFLAVELSDRLLEKSGFELAEPKKIGVSIGAMHDDYFPTIFMPKLPEEFADSIRCCPSSKKIDSAVLDECMAQVGEEIRADGPPVTEHTLPGWMTNVIAGRVANKLNLRGPNFTVDSACSSGVGALIPATYQLMFGDVDMMISGGLNQQLSDTFTCGVCALGAVGEEVTRPFDADGKGFLIGEGGVFFLLKRLADAKRDGDDIIAVVHSVDGSSEADSKSMVAPSDDAVRRSIRRTLEKTSIAPSSIGVVDTHGSANLLSDLVEARSVAAELRAEDGAPPVQLTAIKSHIGHLYGGAGAASLFSTIQTLRERTVPGIRNLRRPRPEIEDISNKVQPRFGTEPLAEEITAGGVNSLGLGGANYFAVITTPDQQSSEESVREGTRTLSKETGKVPFVRADDEGSSDIFVCVTEREEDIASALGRALQQSPIPQFISEGTTPVARLSVTFQDQAELKNKLSNALKMLQGGHALKPLESQGVFSAQVAHDDEPEKLAFCFPGQGTHYIGMGRHLYEGNPAFRNALDNWQALVDDKLGFDLLGHIYGDENDKAISKKLGTLVGAQTALFAVEMGMAEVLKEMGCRPDVMIGHSFGEISALTVAGVWDMETAFEVVAARIRAAETIIEGGGPALGMMSVICSEDQRDAILRLVEGKVVLTNINAPGRFVLAGKLDAVKQTVAVAESFGVDARVLPIGGAFHSKFMEPAREPFRQALLKLPCSRPEIPILSTISGEYIEPSRVSSEFLADHLSSQLITRLNLPREVSRLYEDGIRHFLEVGPGWSMTKMVSAILGKKDFRAVPTLHPKVGDIETFRRARAFLMALGHLGSAAERQNLPGMFSPDFVEYLETAEPAVVALIEEVHKRYRERMQNRAVREIVPEIEDVIRSAKAPSKKKEEAKSASPKASSKVDVSEWIRRVREKLVEVTGYPPEMLEEQLDLEADLGVDSVQRAEIWMALTTEYNLDSEARPTGVRTMAQFAESLADLAGDVAPEVPEEVETPPAKPAVGGQDVSEWVRRVREKLVEVTGYPPEMLEEQLDLEADLGVDSVQRAEIWMALTTEYNLDAEARPTGVRTMAQFAESLADLAGDVTPEVPETESPTEEKSAAATPAVGGSDISEWIQRVREKLVEVTGYPPEMLEEQLDLEADLGVDSVQRAEIWMALTTEYNLDAEARPTGVRTMAQFAESLAGLVDVSSDEVETPIPESEIVSDDGDDDDDSVCRLFISGTRMLQPEEIEPFSCKKVLAIVGKKDKWANSFKTLLSEQGVDASILRLPALLEMSADEVTSFVGDCDTLVYLAHRNVNGAPDAVSDLRRILNQEISKLFGAFRKLAPALEENPVRVIVPVTQDGAFGTLSGGNDNLLGAFPAGFVRSMARELPECRFQLIDTGETDWFEAIEKQLKVVGPGLEIGITSRGLVTQTLSRLAPVENRVSLLEKGDYVLVTGGARGIVFECVLALAQETGCRLLLTGRTNLPDDDSMRLVAEPENLAQAIRQMEIEMVREKGMSLGDAKRAAQQAKSEWEIRRNIKRLEEAGIEVRYEVCDVTDANAFGALIDSVSADDPIRGVIHGAGVQRSKLITELDDGAIARTLGTKISPLLTLLETLDWSQVRLLAGFGSITGLFGNTGQTDYALANDLLGWMIQCTGAQHQRLHAQTIDWTAWVGTGMVSDEEAKRFQEVGLTPLDVESGVSLFMDGVMGSSHAKLSALNASAVFGAGRPVVECMASPRPRKRLTASGRGKGASRARFSKTRDLYLDQHLVEMSPVAPGTFVSEIFLESLAEDDLDLCDIRFRRPLWVRKDGFEVEVVADGATLMLLPLDRPELEDKGMANLSFATCRSKERKPGKGAELKFTKRDLKALDAAIEKTGPSFYNLLDEKFSHALKTGPIFRGIRSTTERGGLFFGAVTLTDDAVWSFEVPGKFVVNPVLADMAVQVACAWAMINHDVMAIPFEIGRLHAAGETRERDAIVICRAKELGAEKTIVDVAVRELDGRLVLAMEDLVLSTIAGGQE